MWYPAMESKSLYSNYGAAILLQQICVFRGHRWKAGTGFNCEAILMTEIQTIQFQIRRIKQWIEDEESTQSQRIRWRQDIEHLSERLGLFSDDEIFESDSGIIRDPVTGWAIRND